MAGGVCEQGSGRVALSGMPSSSRRSDEPPLTHEQSQLAGNILKKRFNPALGSDQLSRATKFMLVDAVNTAFEQQGFPKRYSLTKLDCWTSNALYRWRCVQQQRRPLSWQPKGVIAAAKKTGRTTARREAHTPAAEHSSPLQEDMGTHGFMSEEGAHTPPTLSSGGSRLSPVFDTAPVTDRREESVKFEYASTPDVEPIAVVQPHGRQFPDSSFAPVDEETGWPLAVPNYKTPEPPQPSIDFDGVAIDFDEHFGANPSATTTGAVSSQWWYESSETMFVHQPNEFSANKSHVFRGLLSDHSGCMIIDEPVLHPPSSINESSDWSQL